MNAQNFTKETEEQRSRVWLLGRGQCLIQASSTPPHSPQGGETAFQK